MDLDLEILDGLTLVCTSEKTRNPRCLKRGGDRQPDPRPPCRRHEAAGEGMDASFMEDLDRQIASVMDCNPLLEDEVVRLCEKVRPPLQPAPRKICAGR